MTPSRTVCVYVGEALGRYGFGNDHPFGRDRIHAFMDEMHRRHLDYQVRLLDPVQAGEEELLRFHSAEYVARIKACSATGEGMLDYGDTPAYVGVFEDASTVVGTVLDATRRVMAGEVRRAFVPIGGLHHSYPDAAAGFCVFNDVAVAIRCLQRDYGLTRIAYVDIDAHHGDGIYYPFEDDAGVIFADIHEDGRYNFPNTGFPHETGKGEARGRKLNIPLLPRAGDEDFLLVWQQVPAFLEQWQPQFVFLQAGADGLYGDPLAHLHYSAATHDRVARDLCRIAEAYAAGRLVAVGGGGYSLRNVGRAWTAVVNALLESPMQ
ncbi:MAG TPA: acetoin utilization protein AcuC [Candidatus Competibacteraceae bacterium]|nr:acetoin utilization protein AcuC [Candidatus Competibacteraceae bacterium]